MSEKSSRDFLFLARLLGGMIVWTGLGASAVLAASPVNELSERDRSVRAMASPTTGIINGLPFRDAIDRFTSGVKVNVWLDRHIDPTAPVQIGQVGPTPFAAIDSIAASRGCVVHWVAGVVIVGRAEWVDRVSAEVMSLKTKGDRDVAAQIHWDALATPDEALSASLDRSDPGGTAAPNASLPHDLWPATTWHDIHRDVATLLVRSQFLDFDDAESVSKAVPAEQVTRLYRWPDLTTVREAIQKEDAGAKVRVNDAALLIRATAKAHRMAVQAILSTPIEAPNDRAGNQNRAGNRGGNPAANPPAGAATGSDMPRFSLKSKTAARNALNQLCQAAGRTCRIESTAAAACEAIVQIEESDVTLPDLIGKVAALAGCQATWTDTEVVISVAP
ncbi:hypothetical protein K227x_39470 [Rubripirellula lacrimiformis]|uniref:Uncharacterized protein n=1 Tax=Rubripirellula lacrimiformis TaxID=1930273 RepID=A0A517NEJ0_9BACT|nr:hypothetical protein [Rubripirellula lacrimiformis]QDT05546.1 hypothetical protein K227x_39470 [Rubripirellula lacrimiformis]